MSGNRSRRHRAGSNSSGCFDRASSWSESRSFRPPPHDFRYHDEHDLSHGLPRGHQCNDYEQPSHFEPYRETAHDLSNGLDYADDYRDNYGRPQQYDEMSRRMEPQDFRQLEVTSYGFDPTASQNPFVNGTVAYRFVWGEPLCCRCGRLGHLPGRCRNEPLSEGEQHYLYTIMRREQNRSKLERGFNEYEPTASLKYMPRPCPDRLPVGAEQSQGSAEGDAWGRVEEWRSEYNRPSSRDYSPASARPELVSIARKEGYSRRPLESQEDQFDKFKAGRPKWHAPNMPPPPLRSLPTHDGHSFAKGPNANDPNHSGKAEAPKKNKKKGKGKQDTKSEVDLDFDTSGPANADPAPQVLGGTREQQPSTPLQPVLTQANAADQLRLRPLGENIMGASIRLSNGDAQAVGPHPSTIRVSARYLTQAAIEKYLSPSSLDPQERSQAEAREDGLRLQGVAWIDNVRRALQLPVRTYTSACVFYHKFRLAHPFHEYSFADAAAASLLNACKAEDTLKKSRDILAAAYNLKQPAGHEQVSADDPIFEAPSRAIIGLERLVLESSSFDFTNRAPHDMLVKVAKSLPRSEDKKAVCQLAWTTLTDIHRTFAPLKQTSATLSLACLELAAQFKAATSADNTCAVRDHLQELDLNRWHTTREEVMEILLDALDMYTHHTTQTILGTQYSLDDFLRIRLTLNKECTESGIPRHTIIQPPPSPDNGTSTTLRVSNGHPTPVSPPQAGTQPPPTPGGVISSLPIPEGGGTLRFMLNPQRATDERAEVSRYYTEEWEEYEEEIEVPIQRDHSRDSHRERDRRRDHRDDRYDDGRRSVRDDRGPPIPPASLRDRDRERESLRDRERDAERERARLRDRDRDRRYDDRRYDARERDRRYDDRRDRDRDRDRDRRYYEDDRRRRDDRR